MYFNPYSIPPLFSSLLILSLGLFVLLRKSHSNTNRSFFLLAVSLFIWLFSDAIMYSLRLEGLALLFGKIVYIGVAAIPISSAFLIFSLSKFKLQDFKYYFIGLGIIYFIVLYYIFYTDLIVGGLSKYYYGYYPKAGRGHILFLVIWLLVYSYSFYIAFRNGYIDKNSRYTKEERNRIRYGFWILVFGCIGAIDFMGKYGLEFYPPGYVIIPIFFVITAYSIVKHNVMDINIVLQKGLIYSTLVGFISCVYFLLVFLAEKLFQGIIGYHSFIVSISSAVIIAIFFVPIKNKIQNFVDKIFFRGSPFQIASQNELLRHEVEQTERFKSVATLASGMAHEIKNPLTAIKTFSEYLSQKHNDPEFLDKFSRLVPEQVDRIDKLVHELLDFSKSKQIEPKPTNIHELINDTLDLLSNDLIKRRIDLVKNYADTKLVIQVDPNRMKQAFLNLFLNAIDAMPNGGVLAVETSLKVKGSRLDGNPSASNLQPLTNDNIFEISISDTGCGISKEDLKHIFEPFYSTKENGSGLGLSIVKNILKEHNGAIIAESALGKGTRFKIRFVLEVIINKGN